MEQNWNANKVGTPAAKPTFVKPSANAGIYVHIPFCEKKCFYCDFYSVENHSQRDEFTKSLIREIELFSENHPKLEVDTIFLGGGTPSLLTSIELEKILNSLRRHFDISSEAEFTMECNPGTVNRESLANYRRLGVNRLSFGVQSFFDDELRFLTRIHDSQQAVGAVELARAVGFGNVNIDLIYGLPNQSEDRLHANLEKAIALNPDHISAYNLIVEPGTPLFTAVASGKTIPLDETTEAKMYELVMAFLEENGYIHYEVSNYARRGFECKHNLRYWNCEEYVGFGPSAHSHMNTARWWNVSSLACYIASLSRNQPPVSAKEELTESQLVNEYVLLQLRQGRIDLEALHRKFGVTLEQDFLLGMKNAGYVETVGSEICLTRKGFTVGDEIAEEILARHSISIQIPLSN